MTAKIYSEEEVVFLGTPDDKRFVDITGNQYGRLVVMGFAGKSKHRNSLWFCKCICGNIIMVLGDSIKCGKTISCGCFQIEEVTKRLTIHGHSGENVSPEYHSWANMIDRATNPNNRQYHDYGGRGITVCERWRNSFKDFYTDMGKRPDGDYSIERDDVNVGYCPENCRWATRVEQNNNRRSNHPLTYNNVTKNIGQWGDDLGCKSSTIIARLNKGWGVERALTTPVRPMNLRSRMKSPSTT